MLLSGILLVVFLALSLLIVGLAPQIAGLLLSMLGGEEGAYWFLVQLPVISGDVKTGVGPAALSVFEIMRNVSFILFAVVLVIAALCYALESFRIVSEGTATHIITSSFFTLIAIYLAIPLYNAVAELFNVLTAPSTELILSPGMIQGVAGKAIASIDWSKWGEAIVQFFGAMFFLIMTATALVLVGILGTLRIFFIGALVATLPLWLVLRLTPATKRIAESFIETLMGLMLASLISAIFIRFGYEVTCASGGFTGLMATVAAVGTLIAAAMMPTVLAPKLGGLFTTTSMMASQAISTAVGTTMTVAGGAIIGGAMGGAHLAGAAGVGMTGVQRAGLVLGGAARGAVEGFKPGFTGRLAMRMGPVSIPSPAGIGGALAHEAADVHALDHSFLEERGGTVAEGLSGWMASQPVPGESGELGLQWFENDVARKSDLEVGRMVVASTGLERAFNSDRSLADVGRQHKAFLEGLRAKPEMLDRFRLNLERFGGLDTQERADVINRAVEGRQLYRDAIATELGEAPYEMTLEKWDRNPAYLRDLFSPEAAGDPARTAYARLLQLTHRNFHHNRPNADEGRRYGRQILKEAKELGIRGWMHEKLGVVLPPGVTAEKHAEQHLSEYITTLTKTRPELLHNLKLSLEPFSKSEDAKHANSQVALNEFDGHVSWLNRAIRSTQPLKPEPEKIEFPPPSLFILPPTPKPPPPTPAPSIPSPLPTPPRPAPTPAKLKEEPIPALGEFFGQLDREVAAEAAPPSQTVEPQQAQPLKKRRRGEIIVHGGGGEANRQLNEWYEREFGRKSGEKKEAEKGEGERTEEKGGRGKSGD